MVTQCNQIKQYYSFGYFIEPKGLNKSYGLLYVTMSNEQFLLENIKEFIKQAEKASKDNSYNSAVTLLFKAMAVMCDLFILKKEGFIPKNHTERFQVLKQKHFEIYKILNKDFPVYQQSYRIKLNKDYMKVLENDLKRLTKISKIKI